MTRQELFDSAYGRPAYGFASTSSPAMFAPSYFYGGATGLAGNWMRDPASNPALSSATPDDEVLANNWKLQQLAHEANMRGQAADSARKVAFLQRMLANPYNINTAYAPRDQNDFDLQRIVQADVNARERGAALGIAGEQRKARERRQAIQDNLVLRRQALSEIAAQDRRNTGAGRLDQGQQRIDLAERGLDERRNVNRNRAITNEEKSAFDDIDSGIPILDVLKDHPELDDIGKQRLFNYANASTIEAGKDYGMLNTQAGVFNRRLMEAEDKARADYKTGLTRKFLGMDYAWPDRSFAQADEDAAVQHAIAPILAEFRKNKGMQDVLTYDPEMDAFSPVIPNPAGRLSPEELQLDQYRRQNGQRRPQRVVYQQPAQTQVPRSQLPVVRTPIELARLPYGVKYVGWDGQVHLNSPIYTR